MALSIKDKETERLAREVAKRRGVSITRAIGDSLRAEWKREQHRHVRQRKGRMKKMREILKEIDRMPVLDARSPEEILGFNERGLWN